MMRAPLRLLLVDDEALARSRLRDLLGDIAEEVPTTVVAEAHDGHTALALIQTHPCDIALVDIRMPGMDGLEAARHLALLPEPPAIVFVTAFDQYAVRAFEALRSRLRLPPGLPVRGDVVLVDASGTPTLLQGAFALSGPW